MQSQPTKSSYYSTVAVILLYDAVVSFAVVVICIQIVTKL
jgi:hypothetical protein